ncbi:N-6 DNA methylase [Pseudomonas bananamidigenes]|uniref:N-6 DNA methylase n=1 Tax=Pseudomonas bananamidigenes TaxID=2843610 RepID=UPI000803900E|nr:N-6 DNA methylase [Pseudomonas bananamidigenes]
MQTQSKKKLHGQYYTESAYSSLLVNRFQEDSVSVALELGVGGGALLSAVSGRWPDARCVSVDIDPQHAQEDSARPVQHIHYCADALTLELDNVIGLMSGVADIAVCNPPFISADWNTSYSVLLDRAGFKVPTKALRVGADLLFLAQNLWLLKDSGQLGIIIPAGIIFGDKNRAVRETLLANHCITEVIELPSKAFKNTEVKTFILNLQKNKTTNSTIKLYRCDKDGTIEPFIEISLEEAVNRMDYSYYEWKENFPAKSYGPGKILEVFRGGISTAQARQLGIEVFHTTDLKKQLKPGRIFFSDNFGEATCNSNKVVAQLGDVVIPRVGRNIEGGVHIVEGGKALISDCLYVIRCPGRTPEELYEALTSREGVAWIKAHTHGACARFLTKSDLKKFPL